MSCVPKTIFGIMLSTSPVTTRAKTCDPSVPVGL